MIGRQHDGPERDEHRHLDDEAVLQLALEHGASECPECAARVAKLDVVVGRMRSLLAHESELDARRDAALAERVLASTIGADAAWDRGWRGGVQRSARRARRFLQSSTAWRIAAAALLIQLAALPLVAWVALRKPSVEHHYPARLDSPPEPSLPASPMEGPAEPERRAHLDEPEPRASVVEHELGARPAAELAAALARERESLAAADAPAFDGEPSELEGLARLLALRSRVVHGRTDAGEVAALAPGDEDGALEIALWCEAALDRLALSGVREPGLAPLSRLLARSQASAAQPVELARCALERADRLGALDAESGALLSQMRRTRPLTGASQSSAPLDPAWRAALRRALDERQRSGAGRQPNSASQRVLASWVTAKR